MTEPLIELKADNVMRCCMRRGGRICTVATTLWIGIGLILSATRGATAEIILTAPGITVEVNPANLSVHCTDSSGNRIRLSGALPARGIVQSLEQGPTHLRWKIAELGLEARLALQDRTWSLRLMASQTGELEWPLVSTESKLHSLIIPRCEGVLVPIDDSEWVTELVSEGWTRVAEGWSMPFVGFDFGESTATLIVATPFNTEFQYARTPAGLSVDFRHRFTRLDKDKGYGVVLQFGGESPVEPARLYRQWLRDQGGWVSFADKIQTVPRAERLAGALHAYLWEAGYLHRTNVRDWVLFGKKLQLALASAVPSPLRRVHSLLSDPAKAAVLRLSEGSKQGQDEELITRELNLLIDSTALYQRESWMSAKLPGEIGRHLRGGLDRATLAERCQVNAALIQAAFTSGELEKTETWGDGISVRMLKDLQTAGIDRACLILNDLQAGDRRPEVAGKANEMGYLYAPYDSYHSIHAPSEPDTWLTAQFDAAALENGPIVRADGTKEPGFRSKGFKFSPRVARPYVERRVTTRMVLSPYSAWFVDCDGTGESYDNYSELFPATEGADFAARMDRLQWISRTLRIPVGSETGSGLAAGVLHFAHGMMTPPLAWRDDDFKDRSSPYWMGGYHPPEAPTLFFRPAALKPSTRKFHFDPQYRLPLYQVVFHDSVVTTHHWTSPSLKFADVQQSVALLEQLYNIPPLYHLNRDTWMANSKRIVERHRFFSPLHRELAQHAMTDFKWLTTDRGVQMTTFANGTRIVANFRDRAWQSEDMKWRVPPNSVSARRAKGAPIILTP